MVYFTLLRVLFACGYCSGSHLDIIRCTPSPGLIFLCRPSRKITLSAAERILKRNAAAEGNGYRFSLHTSRKHLDFVRSSLGHLTAAQGETDNAGHKRHLKYAFIHLCSGVELILKERLRQEDWRPVFRNRKDATEEAYETGEFVRVDFKALPIRLEEDCGVDLTPEQKADLKSFRKRRNKVEHFGVVDTLLAMQSSTAKMVSFLVDFIDRNFEVDEFDEEEQELLTDIRNNLGSCVAVVQERRVALIEPEVKCVFGHPVPIMPTNGDECRRRDSEVFVLFLRVRSF